MRDWTEQEEQELIELAKTGDPRANYELSQWALARGEEEPDEPRWNRLAAKCLVKAAQAGYGPAQERMAEILRQQQKDPAPTTAARASRQTSAAAAPEPVRLSDARLQWVAVPQNHHETRSRAIRGCTLRRQSLR